MFPCGGFGHFSSTKIKHMPGKLSCGHLYQLSGPPSVLTKPPFPPSSPAPSHAPFLLTAGASVPLRLLSSNVNKFTLDETFHARRRQLHYVSSHAIPLIKRIKVLHRHAVALSDFQSILLSTSLNMESKGTRESIGEMTLTDSPSLPSAPRDDYALRRIGKKPALRRSFNLLTVLGFSCTVLITWEGSLLYV